VNLIARLNRLVFVVLPVLVAMVGCQPPVSAVVRQEKGMEQFANDKEFHSAHTMSEVKAKPILGKDIEFTVGEGKAKAYWTAPAEGHDQSVIMIHEWWGLNDHIRQTADMVHEKTGYGVLAVDLYEGKVAKTPDDAGKYMAAVDQKKASSTLNAAIRLLKAGVDGSKPSSKLGTIGFCFGGGWSHKAAIMGGDSVKACAVFYGQPTVAPGELERLIAPVLFVWPNKDKWINKEMVDGFKSAMEAAGKPLEVLEFSADHGFANPSSKSYQSKESQEAWDKTLEFLKKNLG